VAALEASLQFTQQEQDDIKYRVATCEKDQIRQETELTRQSIYSRRWNLLLFRISETEGENRLLIVKDVFKNNLQIPDQRVNNMPLRGVHRLGKNTTNGQDRSLSVSPAGQTETTFGASAVFLQSLTSE